MRWQLPVIDMSPCHSKYSKSVIRSVDWRTLHFLATLIPMMGSQQITRTLIFSPTLMQPFDEALQHSCFGNDMKCVCVCVCCVSKLLSCLCVTYCADTYNVRDFVVSLWCFIAMNSTLWMWHDMTWFVVFKKLIYFVHCTKPHEECCSSHSDRFGGVEVSKSVRTENKNCSSTCSGSLNDIQQNMLMLNIPCLEGIMLCLNVNSGGWNMLINITCCTCLLSS